MAVIGNTLFTLADWAKRVDPTGKISDIVELLSQDNAMLDDALWRQGNLPTGHRASIRTGLPAVTWRRLNQGTVPSKSTTAQVDFQCGILEAWSEIDEDEAVLNGEERALRLSEAMAQTEAMSQEVQQTMIYGTAANPEEFVGFSSYYDNKTDNSGENIIDAGGTGSDNMSMWLVGWGERSAYGLFPRGSQAGLYRKDYGLVVSETSGGGRMAVYREHFKWKAGLAVEDWRKTVRIANIDRSALEADPTGATVKLLEYMIMATHKQYKPATVRPVFYTNRATAAMLDIQAQNKTNVYLTVGMEAGKRIVSFRGIPIKVVDALSDNEARVV